MKREKVNYYPGLSKVFPLLIWETCKVCDQEFCRERGWKLSSYSSHSTYYACRKCCPSAIEAYTALIKNRPTREASSLGTTLHYG